MKSISYVKLSLLLCSLSVQGNTMDNNDGINGNDDRPNGKKQSILLTFDSDAPRGKKHFHAVKTPYQERNVATRNDYLTLFHEMNIIANYYKPSGFKIMKTALVYRFIVFERTLYCPMSELRGFYNEWTENEGKDTNFRDWVSVKDEQTALPYWKKKKLYQAPDVSFYSQYYSLALNNALTDRPQLDIYTVANKDADNNDADNNNVDNSNESSPSVKEGALPCETNLPADSAIDSVIGGAEDGTIDSEVGSTKDGVTDSVAADVKFVAPVSPSVGNLLAEAGYPSMSKVLNFTALECAEYLMAHVVGQDEAMTALANSIHMHHVGLKINDWYRQNKGLYKNSLFVKTYIPFKKSNILIMGQTGSGKTLSMEHVAAFFRSKNMEIPVIQTSASSLTRTGYVGPSVTNMLKLALTKANYNVNKANKSIIFLDEIDKIAKVNETTGRDIGGLAVQHELLDMLQGCVKEVEVTLPGMIGDEKKEYVLDTTNMLFICGGAFNGLERVDRTHLSDSQLEDYGFTKEFIGRLQKRIVFNPLTKEMVMSILKNPNESRIVQMEQIYRYGYNTNLRFSEDSYEAIADRALQFASGARSIQGIVDRLVEAKTSKLSLQSAEDVMISKQDVLDIIAAPEPSKAEKERLKKVEQEKQEEERRKQSYFSMYS